MNQSAADVLLNAVESTIDCTFQKSPVFPGEDVTSKVIGLTTSVFLGNGLVQKDNKITAVISGTINYKVPSYYWTESAHKRYNAHVGESVVGIVEDKMGDFYTLNIYSGCPCVMNRLAFDGATKRNKPELNRGDVVFARILSANRDCDTELSCVAASGPKKDWSTGEAVYGVLSAGLVVRVSLGYARRLLQPDNILLSELGKHLCFEVAIGMNGVIWLRANGNSYIDMIVIRNALLSAEELDAAQTIALVEELVKLSKSVHSI